MTPPMTDTDLAEAIRKAESYDPAVEISPSYSLYKREAMLFARALLHYRDENLHLRSRLAVADTELDRLGVSVRDRIYERDAALDEADKLSERLAAAERERDWAVDVQKAALESQERLASEVTTEAIAAWLDEYATKWVTFGPLYKDAARDIRAGAWRDNA